MADGGGCGASVVSAASVYKWVGGWDGRGEPWLRDELVRNVGKLQKYPHRFELGGSFGSGVSQAFRVSGFRRRWEFRARCNFGIARRGLRWREFLENNETKRYLKIPG